MDAEKKSDSREPSLLFSVFRPRPLCDLPRPHLQMLLYIQRTKPSSSILPMIRMPRMLPLVSSTIQQLVELPTECTMAQSIAGPGKYCTRNVKCHPRSVSYPSRKSSATIRAAVLGSWERVPDQPSPSYFSSSKRKRYFPRIVTLLGLVPFEKNHGAASMVVNSG